MPNQIAGTATFNLLSEGDLVSRNEIAGTATLDLTIEGQLTAQGQVNGGSWDDYAGAWETHTVGINRLGLHTEPVLIDVEVGGAAAPFSHGFEDPTPLPPPEPPEIFPPDPTAPEVPEPPWRDRGPGIPRRDPSG